LRIDEKTEYYKKAAIYPSQVRVRANHAGNILFTHRIVLS